MINVAMVNFPVLDDDSFNSFVKHKKIYPF